MGAIVWGLAAMIAVIVLMDQLIWRPDHRLEREVQVRAGGSRADARVRRCSICCAVRSLLAGVGRSAVAPAREALMLYFAETATRRHRRGPSGTLRKWLALGAAALAALAGIRYAVVKMVVDAGGAFRAGAARAFSGAPAPRSCAWNSRCCWPGCGPFPVGVYIGLRPRLSAIAQPIAQVAASVPATALFPIVLLALIRVGGGLGIGSIVLLLLGTQWYILFNVIAGASAIPTDLKEVCDVYRLSSWSAGAGCSCRRFFPT